MGFTENYVKQCRKPEGLFGRFVGRAMNIGHTKVRRWGLSHLPSRQSLGFILDIGCGGGAAIRDMASRFPSSKLYGIDYSPDMVLLSRRINKQLIDNGRLEVTQGTVLSLPYPDSYFDLATAFESYYFWPDLVNDLKEVKRVLKPGGIILLVNEVYDDKQFHDRNKRWANMAHMQIHSPEGFRDFLESSGYVAAAVDVLSEKNWITAVGLKSNTQERAS
jgi:ubiquinone/menaquinone biosynthesis C-methylase UbiE